MLDIHGVNKPWGTWRTRILLVILIKIIDIDDIYSKIYLAER